MVSITLLEKLEQLPQNLQQKLEGTIAELLEIKRHNQVNDAKLPYTMVIGNDDLFGDDNIIDKNVDDFKIRPGFGGRKGLITYMSDDFDAPLGEFKDYM